MVFFGSGEPITRRTGESRSAPDPQGAPVPLAADFRDPDANMGCVNPPALDPRNPCRSDVQFFRVKKTLWALTNSGLQHAVNMLQPSTSSYPTSSTSFTSSG